MKRLNPKRWHALTWVAITFWAALSLWCNVPKTSIFRLMAVYGGEYAVGFPLDYVTYNQVPGSPVRHSFSLSRLTIDILSCVPTMVGLVYCTQQRRQYSIRDTWAVIAVAALALASFRLALSLARFCQSDLPFLAYLLLLYVLPVSAAFALYCRNRRIAELKQPVAEEVHGDWYPE